ncbi:MAG: autotransporter domain-containing protein [Defluviicoccus sp.]|nr:autotransporter domain-containing protein [Defluviicoccus sp.]
MSTHDNSQFPAPRGFPTRRGPFAAPIALVALLSAAPALSQTTPICSDTPAAGQRIVCFADGASTGDIAIDTSGLAIETTEDHAHGIAGQHLGEGSVAIGSRADSIATEGQLAHGILASHKGAAGDVVLRLRSTDIETRRQGAGALSRGIWAETTSPGKLEVEIAGGSVVTRGDDSYAILLDQLHAGSGAAGALRLDIGGGAEIGTEGASAHGIVATRSSDGDIELTLRNAAVATAGSDSDGVWATQLPGAKPDIAGDVAVNLLGGVRIETEGAHAESIFVEAGGNDTTVPSDVTVTARGGNEIVTAGEEAQGILAQRANGGAGNVLVDLWQTSITARGAGGDGIRAANDGVGDIDIRLSGGGVTTHGVNAPGISAWKSAAGPGDLRIAARDHRIATESTGLDTNGLARAHGISATHNSQGNIVIDLQGGSIETRGVGSHGVFAAHQPAEDGGDVGIRTSAGHITASVGDGTIGIFAINFSAGPESGAISIDIGGAVRAAGANSTGVAVAAYSSATGTVLGASPLDEDGYRRQTVRVDGRVQGGSDTGAGVSLAGGGRVFVGPRGWVGAVSGLAMRAYGDTVVDGEPVPRRLLVHLAPDGVSPAELLGGRIVNDGGETVLAVNGTPLYDSEDGGRTGLWAPNGLRDVTLAEGFAGLDFSSSEAFAERYAARAAVYQALPGALLRLDEAGGSGGERLRKPGSPLWLRLSAAAGRYAPRRATVGGRVRYDRYAAEAGIDFALGGELTGWAGARLVSGSARVSPASGSGRIAATGYGLAGGLAWRGAAGFYGSGVLRLTRYDADLSSAARGRLRNGAAALARALDLEGGRRFALGGAAGLTARAWLNGAGVSMGGFADALGSRVSLDEAERLTAGVGAAAETELAPNGGTDEFTLSGGLGLERSLHGKSRVAVSGQTLSAGDTAPRLLLDLGATWKSGAFALRAAAHARGLLSRDKAYGGRLELRAAF